MSPSENDPETVADGEGPGSTVDLFTRRADVSVEESFLDRIRRLLDSYLLAPLAVAWDDWRTRVGGAILVFYLVVTFVFPLFVPNPSPFRHEAMLTPFHDGWFQVTSATVFGVSIPWFKISAALGTNVQGQSMEAMLVYGGQPIFKMIATGALFSVVLGTFIGTLAGFKGGRIDSVLMSITDVMLVVPGLALIVVIASVLEPSNPYVVGLILGIDNWPGLARMIRSQTLAIREEEYIEAHRTLGLSTGNILRRDIISQMIPYISVNFANGSRRIIFESVGLYFIGILPYTSQNWGVLMNSAYDNVSLTNVNQLYYLFEPMIMIVGLSVGLILFAQGLDKVFNVRLQARHADTGGGAEAAALEE